MDAEPLGFEDFSAEIGDVQTERGLRCLRIIPGAGSAAATFRVDDAVGENGALVSLSATDSVGDLCSKPLGFEDLATKLSNPRIEHVLWCRRVVA